MSSTISVIRSLSRLLCTVVMKKTRTTNRISRLDTVVAMKRAWATGDTGNILLTPFPKSELNVYHTKSNAPGTPPVLNAPGSIRYSPLNQCSAWSGIRTEARRKVGAANAKRKREAAEWERTHERPD